MQPSVTDRVPWSLSVSLSVGQSVTVVRPAKMAEVIEMPFWLRTLVGPRNHVLDGGRVPIPNCISIGAAVFAVLTSVTDRQTERPRYSVSNSGLHLHT